MRQGLLDSEGYKEMEWELIRRGFPQALLLSEMINIPGPVLYTQIWEPEGWIRGKV